MDTQEQTGGVNFGQGNTIEIGGDVFSGDKVLGHKITINVPYYPIKLRAPLREVFAPLIEEHTKLFGGRNTALTRIAEFIQNPEGGYLVITAPAGFGKTALLANLVSRTPSAFAYHFFTALLYGHNQNSLTKDKVEDQPSDSHSLDNPLSEVFFLKNVVEQMAQWHGHQELLPGDLGELRALYHKFIAQPLEHIQILILDGLDEVTRWKLDPYLSRRLPEKLHVIVTLRDLRDVDERWQVEYGLPTDQVRHLRLEGLNRNGIAQVLRAAGGSALALADNLALLNQIVQITAYQENERLGADPFYVRVLAEDAAASTLTVRELANQPRGLEAYLDKWWQQIKQMNGERPIRDLFGTLTVAVGPIKRLELEAINSSLVDEWSADFFDDVLHQVRRWVVSDTQRGYTLVHPRLRDYMRTRIKTDPYLDKLLAYCAQWRGHKSTYALAYYAQHLKNAGQREALYKLIDKSWMEVKFQHTFSHRAFAEDVDLAIQVAAVDESTNGLVQLVRNCLIYATLTQLTLQVSPELLSQWVQTGQADKALADAALRGDPEAYLAIARAQLEKSDFAATKDSLAQALQAAKGLGDKAKQTHALCQVAEVWTQLNEPEQAALVISHAEQVVQAIKNRDVRGRAMGAVVTTYVHMGDFDGALQATNTLDNKDYKLRWDYIEPALRDIARGMAQVEQFDGALEVTVKISDERIRAYALCNVAQALAQVDKQERAIQVIYDALKAAEEIHSNKNKVSVLKNVVRVMARVGAKSRAVQIADHVLGAAEQWDKYDKADLLRAMAEALAELGESDRAVQAAAAIGDVNYFPERYQEKEAALRVVAQVLTQVGAFDGALRTVEMLAGNDKEQALIAVARAMAKAGKFQAALQVVETITFEDLRAEAFCDIATMSVRAEQFDHTLQIIERIALVHCKPQVLKDVISVLVKIEQKVQDAQITSFKLRAATAIGDEQFKALYDEIQNEIQNNLRLFKDISEFAALRKTSGGAEVHDESFRLHINQDEPYKERALGTIAQALAQAGEADRALQVAKTIPNQAHQVKVLIELVQALTKAGRKRPAAQMARYAVQVAESIEETAFDKLKLLGDAAQALMQAEQKAQAAQIADQAVRLVKSMVDIQPNHRQELVDVAHVLVQAGQKAQAVQLANLVLGLVEGSKPSSYNDMWVLRGMLQVLMQAGKKRQATKVVNDTLHKLKEKSKDRYSPPLLRMLEAVASVLVQTGKYKLALQVAETVFEDDHFKAQALCEIAQTMVQAGLKQQAVSVVNRALQVTETIVSAYTRLEILRKVAQVLVEADEQVQLVKLANAALSAVRALHSTSWTSSNASNAKKALQELIRLVAQAGECGLALNLATGIEPRWEREPMMSDVAQALAESGELDLALSIATAMDDGFAKERALHKIARRVAQAGDFDLALQIAGEDTDKAQVLCDVAQALLLREEKAQAIDVAHDVLSVLYSRGFVSDREQDVKSDVVYVLAQAGEFSRALQIVETIPAEKNHPLSAATHKEHALRQLLRSLAQGGEFTQATILADRLLQIAEEVSSPKNSLAKFDKHRFGQPPVLSEFAQAMAQAGMDDDWVWRAVELVSSTEDKIDTLSNIIQVVTEQVVTKKRSHSEAQRFLNSTLKQARLLSREAVFGVLAKSAVFLASADQGQTLWRLYEEVTAVERWWTNKNLNSDSNNTQDSNQVDKSNGAYGFIHRLLLSLSRQLGYRTI